MFNSLFANLLNWIAEALDFVITWVLELLGFSLSFFPENFPVISTMYTILQGVGVGLVVAIAAFQLIKYFTGPLAEVSTNPIEIGVRAALSIALIWFGNYFLEGIVNLFTYPYEALMNVNANDLTIGFTSLSSELASLISGAAGVLLALILVIAVGWNLIKLIIEVVERYLMVGILTYTSPLAWPTLTSRNTQSIFGKWFSMFLGQCLLMLLNVWSLKMVLSVFGNTSANVFLRLILALAFCKVAQKFDTYLQSLGINAAHTGGSMIDDVMAVGHTIAGIGRFGARTAGGVISGAGNTALGESLMKGGLMGGLAYKVGDSIGAKRAANMGNSVPYTKPGEESGIYKGPDNMYHWQDKNGNDWSGRTKNDVIAQQAGVRSGYAQTEGESGIMKTGSGKYQWTDKNGNTYTSDSLSGILSKQKMARAAYSAGAANKESSINRNPDGSYSWTDKNGNSYTNASLAGIQEQQAAVRKAYGEKSDENDRITQTADGKYQWTDKNGNTYTNDSLAGIQEQRAMAKAAYADKIGKESDIIKNADGSYQWTDKDGQVWKSNNIADMETTRNTVRNGYANSVTADTNSSLSSLRNKDLSMYASRMFNDNGTPKMGVTTLDSMGREVLTGNTGSAGNIEMANKIANISTPNAMQTGAGADNISAIKAATIMSRGPETARALMNTNVQGGIVDERAVGAAYETLFGTGENMPQNGIDSVIPGLSDSVSSANGELIDGSGDVSDLKINNGEMSGLYTPVDSDGNDMPMQEFSIRSEEGYAALTPNEQSGYTKFEGADGDTYYARSSDAKIDDYEVMPGSSSGTVPTYTSDIPVSGGSGSDSYVSDIPVSGNETVYTSDISGGSEFTVSQGETGGMEHKPMGNTEYLGDASPISPRDTNRSHSNAHKETYTTQGSEAVIEDSGNSNRFRRKKRKK